MWSTCQQPLLSFRLGIVHQPCALPVGLLSLFCLFVNYFFKLFVFVSSSTFCCLLHFNLRLFFRFTFQLSFSFSVSLLVMCPPYVLGESQVGLHCWLHVYFYPTAKCLLITVDKYRYVTLSFFATVIFYVVPMFCFVLLFFSDFTWKSYISQQVILCPDSHSLKLLQGH